MQKSFLIIVLLGFWLSQSNAQPTGYYNGTEDLGAATGIGSSVEYDGNTYTVRGNTLADVVLTEGAGSYQYPVLFLRGDLYILYKELSR